MDGTQIPYREKITPTSFQRVKDMKTATGRFLIAVFLMTVFSAAQAQDGKIAVLSPKGNPPPIPLVPMAPRLETLDGKTLYFVDVGYEGGGSLLRATMDWLSQNYPKTNLVFREKAGTYDQDDPKLMAEIKSKADGIILAVGH
jgi:hypothetical protein